MSNHEKHDFVPCTCEDCFGRDDACCAYCHSRKSDPIHTPAEAPTYVEAVPRTGHYSDPTRAMLDDPIWNAIWEEIKTWDVNVPSEYAGYCGATGNHATAIFLAIQPALQPTAPAEAQAVKPPCSHCGGTFRWADAGPYSDDIAIKICGGCGRSDPQDKIDPAPSALDGSQVGQPISEERLAHANGALSDIAVTVTSCIGADDPPRLHQIAEAVLNRILCSASMVHSRPTWFRHEWEKKLWEEYESGRTHACGSDSPCKYVAALLRTAANAEASELLALRTENADAKAIAHHAFVEGAKWWEWHKTGATMWAADQQLATEEAEKKYPYISHPLLREMELENASLLAAVNRSNELDREAAEKIVALEKQVDAAREEGRREGLEQAAKHLSKYFRNHGMSVKDIIGSQWARGVHSGRQEAVNVLNDFIRTLQEQKEEQHG